jgi:hypothetical protein
MYLIKNSDLLLLGLFILICIIFLMYYPQMVDDVDTTQKQKIVKEDKIKMSPHNGNFEMKNNDKNIDNGYNKYNLYSEDIYYDNNGFHNELMAKNKQYNKGAIDHYFQEIRKEVPYDENYICKNIGECPVSREQKNDLPLNNVPMSMLKNMNKNIRLSNEIKDKPPYSELEDYDFVNPDISLLKDKNRSELPLANINVNCLNKSNSSFISSQS